MEDKTLSVTTTMEELMERAIKTEGGTITARNILVVSITGDNSKVKVHFPPNHGPPPERIKFNIHDCIDSFTGREEILAKLNDAIQENRMSGKLTVLSQSRVVTGIGGVGKTETVRKYVHRYMHEYDHVVWINADRASEARTCFRQIASLCHIRPNDYDGNPKEEQFLLEEIYDFLCQKRCLMVFDNVESMDGSEGIQKFLPGTIKTGWETPAIIVTSRNRTWKNVTELQLAGLEEHECYALLISQLKFEDTEENRACAKLIAGLCEGLPLAIQQTIAIIQEETEERKNQHQMAYSMQDFLNDLEGGKKTFAVIPDADTPLKQSVYNIFQLAFLKIRRKEYGHMAIECLKVMPVLNPNNIPKELLLYILKGEDKNTLGNALYLLHRYSLITNFQDFFKIHRVIQMVTLLPRPNVAIPAGIECSIVDVVAGIVPNFQDFLNTRIEFTAYVYEVLENGLRLSKYVNNHVRMAFASQQHEAFTSEQFAQESAFLLRLAESFSFYEKYYESEELLKSSCFIEMLGDPATLTECAETDKAILNLSCSMMSVLGRDLFYQGKYDEAAEVYQQTIDLSVMANPATTLIYKNDLAKTLLLQGKPSEAASLLEETLKKQEEVVGPNNVDIIETKANLISAYVHAGRVRRVKEIVEYSMQHQYQHIISAPINAVRRFVEALKNDGQITLAISLMQDTMEYRKEYCGGIDSKFLEANIYLADLLRRNSNLDSAEMVLNDVLQKAKAMLGADHPTIILARQYLALTLINQRRFQEGVEILEDWVKKQKKQFGTNPRSIHRAQEHLAEAYTSLGRFAESVQIYEEVLQYQEKELGASNQYTLGTKEKLVGILIFQRNYDSASDMLRSLLQIQEPDEEMIVDTLSNKSLLADILTKQGKLEAAVELYREVLDGQKSLFDDPAHLETITTRQNLVKVFKAQGNLDAVVEMYREILEIQDTTPGGMKVETINTQVQLAIALFSQGNYEGGVGLCEVALENQEKLVGYEQSLMFRTKGLLAFGLLHRGKYNQGADVLEDVLNYQRRALGNKDPETIATRKRLAHYYTLCERIKDALLLFEEFLQDELEVQNPTELESGVKQQASKYWRIACEDYSSTLEQLLLPENSLENIKRNPAFTALFEAHENGCTALYLYEKIEEIQRMMESEPDAHNDIAFPVTENGSGVDRRRCRAIILLECLLDNQGFLLGTNVGKNRLTRRAEAVLYQVLGNSNEFGRVCGTN